MRQSKLTFDFNTLFDDFGSDGLFSRASPRGLFSRASPRARFRGPEHEARLGAIGIRHAGGHLVRGRRRSFRGLGHVSSALHRYEGVVGFHRLS